MCRFLCFCAVFAILLIQNTEAAGKYERPPKFNLRPKSTHCESDNKTVMIKYCYIKALSRRVVAAFLGIKINVPVTKPLYVQLIINYRYGLKFHQVIDTKQIEWCSVMDGNDIQLNPLIKLFVNNLKEKTPKLFQKCPYYGDLDFQNISVITDDLKDSEVFPEGTYRSNLIVYKNNKKILTVNADSEFKSPVKENFG